MEIKSDKLKTIDRTKRNSWRNKMKLCIENDDTLCIKNNCIEVDVKNNKYSFNKSEIEEIHIITTNLGPS